MSDNLKVVKCATCGLEAAVAVLGWQRDLDDRQLPDAVRTIIAEAFRAKGVPVCRICKPLCTTDTAENLYLSVIERFEPLLPPMPGIRQYVAARAWALYWQAFLWTANRTDLGETIDLYDGADPAIRAWYDLIARSYFFDPADIRCEFPEGNIYVWAHVKFINDAGRMMHVGHIVLEGIETPHRRTGNGTALVKRTVEVVDTHRVAACGKVEPYVAFGLSPTMDKEALFKFYEGFGFRRLGTDVEPDFVVREPN